MHFADTDRAVGARRTRSSPRGPYAFLDDEEFQNRRTNAVTLRRGLTVDLAAIGALDPDAIEQVHAEITPEPESADDLPTCCRRWWSCGPAPSGSPSSTSSSGAARRWCSGRGEADLWSRPSVTDDAGHAFADDEDAIALGAARPPGDHRHHHGGAAWPEVTTLTEGRVQAGLA